MGTFLFFFAITVLTFSIGFRFGKSHAMQQNLVNAEKASGFLGDRYAQSYFNPYIENEPCTFYIKN